MNLYFYEIFDLVENAKSRKDKIEILRRHETVPLRGLLRINFDPKVSMNLPGGEPPYKKTVDKPAGYEETNFIQEYKRFYIWLDPKTQISTSRKEQLFIQLLEGLNHKEAEIMCLIKDKKLQTKFKSLKYDLVQEAFYGLLPIIDKDKENVQSGV